MEDEITYTIAGAQYKEGGRRFSLGLNSFSTGNVADCFARVEDELGWKYPKKGVPDEWKSEGGWYVGKLGEGIVKFRIKATYTTYVTDAHTEL